MTDLEYVLLNSIAPLGALVIAFVLLYLTRDRHSHPGE